MDMSMLKLMNRFCLPECSPAAPTPARAPAADCPAAGMETKTQQRLEDKPKINPHGVDHEDMQCCKGRPDGTPPLTPQL